MAITSVLMLIKCEICDRSFSTFFLDIKSCFLLLQFLNKYSNIRIGIDNIQNYLDLLKYDINRHIN
jgi:hypothetical protein